MEAPVAEVSTAALEEANALAARFEAAAAAAADFPAGKLSSEQKLHLYGLFKQATVGPAPLAPTTSALDIVGRMKHQAWSGMRDLTRAAAMAKYGSYVESLQARDRRALALSVRFLQVRYTQSTSKRGNEAYAVYEIDCREGSHSWRCIVRWSDLARLWDALQLFHLSEMKLAQSSLPTFYRHTVTTSKVDRTLCEQRAQTMQQLLRGMARVWDVSVLEERGPSTLRHFLSSGSDVEKRTPESAWYTAAGGWPTAMVQAAARKLAPRSLVPHAGEAPALHPPLASAIGEVRIEVLEAVGLLQATRPTAALLDLRSEVAFDEMHLQGAASFSLSTLPHRTAELPPSSSAGLHLLGASVAELAHARHFLNEQVC
jgi:carboxylesterase